MTLYFLAGEASGDSHGAALMRSLGKIAPELRWLGRGGPQMKALAGADFIDWIDTAGVVGLWEVLKNYSYFRREMQKALAEIAAAQPDAVVLIDYPGFNLRLARRLRKSSLGGKIIFYISPQVWAWNRGRIPRMARTLDLMLCIFPFEAELYAQSGLPAVFVGHPLLDRLVVRQDDVNREKDLIGLFPGSRAREVKKILPVMLAAAQRLQQQRPDLRFEIAAASEVLAKEIRQQMSEQDDSLGNVEITVGEATRAMQKCAAGMVASGTATLEAAFFRLPFVLVYKVATLTYLAGKLLIRVPFLGMPNLLAGREIVPEFIQEKARPAAIARALLELLESPARRAKMLADFAAIATQLGRGGASEEAARTILATLGRA